MDRHTIEKGQVLVLIILAIVVIFGFAALAVDGGRYFSERRRAQNAADAAAYAAAYAGAKSLNWSTAGINSTQTNGYDDTDAGPNPNPAAPLDVRISHPPERGKYSVASDTIRPNEYYQVIIRTRVNKIFSQLVYNGDLWVEVEAVTRATPQMGFPSGSAVVATCPDCCDALDFTGTGDINVVGGNVISNSTAGSHSCNSVERNGTAVVDITSGSLISGGSVYSSTSKACKDADGNVVTPCLDADTIQTNTENPQTYSYPFVPSCAGLPTITASNYTSSATLSQGIYQNGIQASGNKTVLTLTAGMYCLEGDFNVSSASVIGSNVMIYMKSGSITINTTNPVNLTAPTTTSHCIADPAIAPNCWSGFLIFMPYDNHGTINLAGGGSTNYSGTIYATGYPNHNPKCTFAGSQVDTQMNASIICYTVRITGTNTFTVNYDANLNAQAPGSIELAQ